jgi:hypothetical protein
VDALLGRKRIRTNNMVLSVVLALIFGTISVGLRFGLTQSSVKRKIY